MGSVTTMGTIGKSLVLAVAILLLGGTAQAQALTLKAALVKAQEAEQRARAAMQALEPYKLWKAAADTVQQLEALVKAESEQKPEK